MDITSTPLIWTELPKEKKEIISQFYGDLQALIEFNNKANQNIFVYLYGEQMGEHLWQQFRKIDNFLNFMKYLDEKNREVLLTNVYGWDKMKYSANPLYAHCL